VGVIFIFLNQGSLIENLRARSKSLEIVKEFSREFLVAFKYSSSKIISNEIKQNYIIVNLVFRDIVIIKRVIC